MQQKMSTQCLIQILGDQFYNIRSSKVARKIDAFHTTFKSGTEFTIPAKQVMRPLDTVWPLDFEQEAQLPIRNRASAMHFFEAKLPSIAIMTYSYTYHLRNLRPASLLRTQRLNFSMRPQHLHMTCDSTVF